MAAIKALQQWCKQQCEGYRDVSITNMTTSFRDGLAFCAILHKHRSDLIDFNSLSKENVYENNHLAFRVAEEKLGIPALLDAEDMVKLKVPDRLSILTYVSQYYNYFHGRSPIGGMGGIKRPPPESNDEPVGKKVTSNAPVHAHTAASTPQPAPRTKPAVLKQNNVTENPPVRAGIREINGNSTISSNCAMCGKHVHLVQRHLADGKLYHRNCFRCKQCSGTLQPGNYKPGGDPGTFVCTSHHHSITFPPVTANIAPTGPHKSALDPYRGNKSSSVTVQEQTNKTPTNRHGVSVTSTAPQNASNRTAVNFVSNFSSSPTDAKASEQAQPKKPTYDFPSTANRGSPSTVKKTIPEPTNRTAVGFNSGSKDHAHASNALSLDQPNKGVTGYLNNRTGGHVATSFSAQELSNKSAVGNLPASKAKTDNPNFVLHQNKDANKEPVSTSQPTKTPSFATTVFSPTARLSSQLTKDQPKETDSSPKLWSSSAAKNKEAREKFFLPSPAVVEPTNRKSTAVKESQANGTGKTVTITITPSNAESHTDKDQARNFLLKNIPGSTSPKLSPKADNTSGVYIPHRILDHSQNGPNSPTSKNESLKPVPTERESAVPKSVSNPKLPSSTPTYSVNKGPTTQSTSKSPIPTNIQSSGLGSKGEVLSPKSQNIISKKSETPEDWRAMLKSVEKRPSVTVLTHGKDKCPIADQGAALKKPTIAAAETKKPTIAAAETKKPNVTSIVTMNIGPSPSGKEDKPLRPSAPSATQTQETKAPSTPTPPKKKLLPAKLDLITDWPTAELRWQEGNVEEPPKWRPHWAEDINNPSAKKTEKGSLNIVQHADFKSKNDIVSPVKQRPDYIPEEAIQQQLKQIDQELDHLEMRGVDLEKQLRSCDGDDTEDALMVDWFKLIHEKQLLLRLESELMYISKQQALEDQQMSVDMELRNLMNKPEHLKSPKDKNREKELLDKLLDIVNDRSEIIECLDEDRIREKEEDEMMKAIIQKHSVSQKEPSPELPKNKNKFRFSGLWKSKEKNKT